MHKMPAIWIWSLIILLFAVISVIYLIRRPASHRLPVSICVVEVLLFGILTSILEPLPLNILYVLILASTPLLAIGILVISALAACRRERSSGHASCSNSARILHGTGRSDSTEPTRRQNTVSDAVLFGLEGCCRPCATPKIRYGSV